MPSSPGKPRVRRQHTNDSMDSNNEFVLFTRCSTQDSIDATTSKSSPKDSEPIAPPRPIGSKIMQNLMDRLDTTVSDAAWKHEIIGNAILAYPTATSKVQEYYLKKCHVMVKARDLFDVVVGYYHADHSAIEYKTPHNRWVATLVFYDISTESTNAKAGTSVNSCSIKTMAKVMHPSNTGEALKALYIYVTRIANAEAEVKAQEEVAKEKKAKGSGHE